MTSLDDWLTILRWPSCGGPSLAAEAATIRCLDCGGSYPVAEGIIDFVAGRETTTLDDIDYDNVYLISHEQPLLLLTYGATESPFRAASFDSCFGSSVVHHILAVGAFLADMVRLLRTGGVTFFVESNARFHRALLATLAAILMDMGHDEPDNPGLALMANWLANVNQAFGWGSAQLFTSLQ